MGRARLTYDKILTILIEIESIINSRPLTYMSDNHDESFITPHYTLRHINEKYYKYDARNEITSDQIREDFNSKITNVKSYFIKRFEDEYITDSQEREYYNHKKFKNSEQLVIGDVVLVKGDNLPRMSWRKGRIINVIRGADKLIRGAEIKKR